MSKVPARKAHRLVARLYTAMVVAVAAGTMQVLYAAGMLSFKTDPRSAWLLIVAAMWVPQHLIAAAWPRRH